MKRLCGPGIVVSEDDCLRAVALAFDRLKIVVEPGGAAALAAALFHPEEIAGDAVIAVATGGNVDPAVFAKALGTLG
jgi:threonine dehydratase